MLGKLLGQAVSGVVKIATLPIDVAESGIDIISGGDGSKRSKKQGFAPLSDLRDGICKGIEDATDEL